ncbi:NAD(P)/FAD-dependent oxidoreductase [Clostridium peptidivorans]|uniref:NAD(P)/FAD-dependent oxidoreductase n=1 Tax=Clostridium peptidivorans TaxID=100174 RepID=UPI000BE4449B|nr:NAD(P)/FAD-dependent oxidoreductase [Clostridium peptidivorans]
MHYDIIVVGAGASGIMTAITSKDRGLQVAILEGNNRIGKKILTTGNGRCNITNKYLNIENFHSLNNVFPKDVLNKFTVNNTLDFFKSIGLPLIELEEGKMFPLSLQASSVLDILRFALEERNVPIHLDTKINKVQYEKSIFKIFTKESETYTCDKLVLSCGGSSAPSTGSDGSGYTLAKTFGHTIISPVPGLVQLKLDYSKIKALSGIKFQGSVEAFSNNKFIRKECGELLFTDYGISGPPILQISSFISRDLYNKKQITLKIDMFPHMNYQSMKDFLDNHFGVFGYRSISESLIGILNKKLIPVLLKEAQINDIHKPCFDLSWKERENILNLIKSWEFNVYDTNSFANSQVTCGGIDTAEVNSITLESKKIKNLFFTGEILDVNADCGGFNLQWAWSSGYTVGMSL